MPKMQLLCLLFATVVIAATIAQADSDNTVINNQISLLRRHYGSVSSTDSRCLSWRFGVETNNIIGWITSVPEECELYVGQYMLGHQYSVDSKVVTKQATQYAKSLTVSEDGKDIWILDIDETVLSNLPYYAKCGFGVQPFNPALFDEWVWQERAQALPKSYKLYKKLLALGFKIVFLSERHEDQRAATENNLRIAGFREWEQVILKQDWDVSATILEYKSAQRQQLVDAGYKIVGNIGDQWSDIRGAAAGDRTFKLPNPMYQIS